MTQNQPDKDSLEVFTDSHYSHVESFAQAAGWFLDYRQIDPGPLKARLTVFGTPHFRVVRIEFDRSFHQLGYPPAGVLTFGLPDPSVGALRWQGAETPAGILINFNHKDKMDVVNPPGEFGAYTLNLTPELLSSPGVLADHKGDLLKELEEKAFWVSNTGVIEELRSQLDALTTVAREEGNAGLAKWRKVFEHDLPSHLIDIISGESYTPTEVLPAFRAGALHRATEILASYEQMPDKVDALCQLACCSWDTLKRAFTEEYGVGPKAYMKSRRLAAVQAELIKLGSDAVISDVANKWGFWHMGSFAADYRRQFGELPSETLRRIDN